MAKILITGSADGLGLLAAKQLIAEEHDVVLHARNKLRAAHAIQQAVGAKNVLIADLSSIAETKQLAEQANELGSFDAVIHNAGLYQVSPSQESEEGFPLLLAVNTLAPYVLTCLIQKPKRLIYLSSGMHLQGDPTLSGLLSSTPSATYSDTKLHNLILAKAVARKWPSVIANAVDPGWVPTKMGGKSAPDSLALGFATQVWLATSADAQAQQTGRYLHHKQNDHYRNEADDAAVQEHLLALCFKMTGIAFPNH